MKIFGAEASILRQDEVYEGKLYNFTVQLQLCPLSLMGTTGFPLNIITAVTPRGGEDSKEVEHTLMTVVMPVPNLSSVPVFVDDENCPRLGKKGDCILLALRSKCVIPRLLF